MKAYEGMFIVRPDIPEDQTGKVAEGVSAAIEGAGGKIEESSMGSKQRLSFPIGKKEDGVYLCVRFRMRPSALPDLDRTFRGNGDLLRHMILKRT